MPIRLVNNILLAECGILSVHVTGRYLQRRCYSWMIDYQYCDDDPWFGFIRTDWSDEGKLPPRMSSDALRIVEPHLNWPLDKAAAMAWHTERFDD